jgi:hypothetical protein
MSSRQQQFLELLQPEILEEFRSRYEGINPANPRVTVEGLPTGCTRPVHRDKVIHDQS